MEVMEEEERKQKIRFSSHSPLPTTIFLSPLYLFFSPSPPPSPSFTFRSFLSGLYLYTYFMEIIFPHTDTTEQNNKKL